jgi:isopentenyl-diphosphate delta-isomerase
VTGFFILAVTYIFAGSIYSQISNEMGSDEEALSRRKLEHLEICKTDDPAFKIKTAGFEQYDFVHYAITELTLNSISLEKTFLQHPIEYPVLISCMTGGAEETDNINVQLAEAANILNIPLGLGSLRYALNTNDFDRQFEKIRETAGRAPLLANIGAAQFVSMRTDFSPLQRLIELTASVCLTVHVNPLQELLQKNGEPEFSGLLNAIKRWRENHPTPLVFKEVGSGISKEAAEKLLTHGAAGIDVAGAGGTSWAGVEYLRNNDAGESEFWDWGIPTSYCIKTVRELKKEFDFMLIGSGGINSAFDAAKALALGADVVASARVVLQRLNASGVAGVVNMVREWFGTLRKIMYLTNCATLEDFNERVIIAKKEYY